MDVLGPTFFVTFAVVQTIVFLFLIRFLDLYEREPLSLLGVLVVWGAIGATAISAVGNAAVERLLPPRVDVVFGPAIYAPVVEESAKGAALLVALGLSVWAWRRFGILHFQGVTDGIVYGAAVGLGFSFTEDVLYLLMGAAQNGLDAGFVDYLSRRDFFGIGSLHHAIYSGAFGAGLGLATWSRTWRARIAFPVLGLLVAMLLHGINNGLVQLVLVIRHGFDTTAEFMSGIAGTAVAAEVEATSAVAADVLRVLDYAIVGVFGFVIMLWLRYQRRVIRMELEEETKSGLISRTEWELLPSYWKRSMWYWELVKNRQFERWRLLSRLHNELVEFAFLKHRLKKEGRDGEQEIERARQLLVKLKSQKLVFL